MGQRTGIIRRYLLLVFMLLCMPVTIFSQKHDKAKYYQIRSMEMGTWNFNPGTYYYILHKNYSGGEMYWKWSPNGFGINYRFKESKSKVGSIMSKRVLNLYEHSETSKQLDPQIEDLKPLVEEESVRMAERMIDPFYGMYKDDFKELGNSIKEFLTFTMEKSGDKLLEPCERLLMEYDTICSQIEYIHQTGLEHLVEPTKRQLEYEEAKEALQNLNNACSSLASYASTLKKL